MGGFNAITPKTAAILNSLNGQTGVKGESPAAEKTKARAVGVMQADPNSHFYGGGSGSQAVSMLQEKERAFYAKKPSRDDRVDVVDMDGATHKFTAKDLLGAAISHTGGFACVNGVDIRKDDFIRSYSIAERRAIDNANAYAAWHAEGMKKGFVAGSENEVHYVAGGVRRGPMPV